LLIKPKTDHDYVRARRERYSEVSADILANLR
jgi:hypothetical protein